MRSCLRKEILINQESTFFVIHAGVFCRVSIALTGSRRELDILVMGALTLKWKQIMSLTMRRKTQNSRGRREIMQSRRCWSPRPPALEEKIAASRLERQKASTRKKAEKGRIRRATETDKERAIRHKKTAARLLSKSGFMTHTDGTEIRTVGMNFLGKALGRQWPIRPDFRKVVERLQKIQNGDEKESSLLVLDDEFFQLVRKV